MCTEENYCNTYFNLFYYYNKFSSVWVFKECWLGQQKQNRYVVKIVDCIVSLTSYWITTKCMHNKLVYIRFTFNVIVYFWSWNRFRYVHQPNQFSIDCDLLISSLDEASLYTFTVYPQVHGRPLGFQFCLSMPRERSFRPILPGVGPYTVAWNSRPSIGSIKTQRKWKF